MRAHVCALCVSLAAIPANAGDSDLLFVSISSDYLGAGWMRAPRGLDRTGPVFGAEVGTSMEGTPWVLAAAGWRLVEGRLVATLTAGAEAGEVVRPLAVADLWWDEGRFMATARAKATPDYADWRVAAGLRPDAGWPWLGLELSAHDGPLRVGFHVTGVDLPGGTKARVSAGLVEDGVYGELSLWRRF